MGEATSSSDVAIALKKEKKKKWNLVLILKSQIRVAERESTKERGWTFF